MPKRFSALETVLYIFAWMVTIVVIVAALMTNNFRDFKKPMPVKPEIKLSQEEQAFLTYLKIYDINQEIEREQQYGCKCKCRHRR